MVKRAAKKKAPTFIGPRCTFKKCSSPGVLWRRLNWWCRAHVAANEVFHPNCSHSTAMHYGGVMTCSWCASTLAHDWPREVA